MIPNPPILFFRWKGHRETTKLKGKSISLTPATVIHHLKNQNIHIDELEDYHPSWIEKTSHKLQAKDILLFTQQMNTLLSAGLPIVQALMFLSTKSRRPNIQVMLLSIEYHINNGMSLASALRNTHALFQGIYADLIEVGEISGNLTQGFENVLRYLEKKIALRKKVIKASIYPSIVVGTSLILTYIMLIFIIPEFETIYQSLNTPLPTITRLILSVSHQSQVWGSTVLSVAVISIMLWKIARQRIPNLNDHYTRCLLKLPIIGNILTKIAITQLMTALATCYNSGLSILVSLDTATKSTQNSVFSNGFSAIKDEIATGKSLYSALSNTTLFPDLVLQMVLIGEESGTLGEMFAKIATNYQQDVDHFVDNLGKIIEPFVILFLGVVVGSLVMAMYLPIFNLMNSFG